jgi:hypothetical protein
MFWRQPSCSAVIAAQNSKHDLPPGMAVLAQFISWHVQ